MVFGSADIHITQELFWKLGSGLYLFVPKAWHTSLGLFHPCSWGWAQDLSQFIHLRTLFSSLLTRIFPHIFWPPAPLFPIFSGQEKICLLQSSVLCYWGHLWGTSLRGKREKIIEIFPTVFGQSGHVPDFSGHRNRFFSKFVPCAILCSSTQQGMPSRKNGGWKEQD